MYVLFTLFFPLFFERFIIQDQYISHNKQTHDDQDDAQPDSTTLPKPNAQEGKTQKEAAVKVAPSPSSPPSPSVAMPQTAAAAGVPAVSGDVPGGVATVRLEEAAAPEAIDTAPPADTAAPAVAAEDKLDLLASAPAAKRAKRTKKERRKSVLNSLSFENDSE